MRLENERKKKGQRSGIDTTKHPTDPGYHRKVTTSPLDITNDSQQVSPLPTGDHKASINRRTRKHTKTKTEIT